MPLVEVLKKRNKVCAGQRGGEPEGVHLCPRCLLEGGGGNGGLQDAFPAVGVARYPWQGPEWILLGGGHALVEQEWRWMSGHDLLHPSWEDGEGEKV